MSGAAVLRQILVSADVCAAALSVPGDWMTTGIERKRMSGLLRAVESAGQIVHMDAGSRGVLHAVWLPERHSEILASLDALVGPAENVRESWFALAVAAPTTTPAWTRWGEVERIPRIFAFAAPKPMPRSIAEGSPDEPVTVLARAEVSAHNIDDALLDSLFCFVLGGVPSARLQHAVRDEMGLAYYVASSVANGTLNAAAQCPRRDAGKVLTAIECAVRSMSRVDPAEVEKARAYFTTQATLARCNPLNMATGLAGPPGEHTAFDASMTLLEGLQDSRFDAARHAGSVAGRYQLTDFQMGIFPSTTREGAR
ncbi:insulinase family protein [Rhodococcus qingshengii]|uniref:insulinase family protein n=1 Tax=Rhodococcus qingshengii TaxID=334542 RepID=UPI003646AE87